jgi:hypothetical protein
MSFTKAIIFILTLLTTIASQCQTKNRESSIKEIDSFAKVYDYRTFPKAYKNHHYRLTESESIGYTDGVLVSCLHLIWYHGMNSKLDSVLFYGNKFENVEALNKNKELKFQYLFDKANLLNNNLGLTEQGLNTYIEAYNLVEKGDINKKIRIEAFIAKCYIDKKRYDKAINTLSKYVKDSSKIETITKFDLFTILSMAYQSKKMVKESFQIDNIILQLAKKTKNVHEEYNILNFLSYDYYLMGNYQKAIDSGLSIRKRLNKHAPEQIPTNTKFLSIYYNAIGDTKNAIYYLSEAINTSMTYDDLPDLYNDLAGYYAKDNETKLSLDCYKKRNIAIDSIRSMEQKAFTDYYDTKIKFVNQEQDKKNLEILNSKQRAYIISLIIGMACLLLFIVSFIIYRKYNKSEQALEDLKQNEKEILKNHIKVRENELSAMLIAQAKKTDQLVEIQKVYTEATNLNNKEQLVLANKSLDIFINDTENIDVFTERLESQYPDIVHQLLSKHPGLSSTDIKHALLIKLGLSLKESAQLLNISTVTVKKARNRVVKKLELPEDINFKDYLDSITAI